ncbi:MAG: VCBS repeat-containing protein, partial [Parasphingopyxis sp.]|uniref:FG-GAP repeat domain-containing protein n=1 Tax=Parasphingopyxis sp. TaxID=1920299 RepID=UPI0032ECB28C
MRFALLAAVAGLGAAPAQAQDRDFRINPLLLFEFPAQFTAEVELADVDGDGDLDVLAANGRHWAQQDLVHINAGNGRLLEARPIGGFSASYVIRAGDFDGDGDADIVVVRDTLPAMVFHNDGAGHFEIASELSGSGGAARGARLADLNGDGVLDLVIARRRDADLAFLGDGRGGFGAARELPGTGGASTDIAAADIDGDGDTDLLVASRDGDPSLVLLNDGSAAFV